MSSADDIFEGEKVISKPLLVNSKAKDLEVLFGEASDIKLMDTRTYSKEQDVILEDIPEKITGTYTADYNICYVDSIIRRKLTQEKFTILPKLKLTLLSLEK